MNKILLVIISLLALFELNAADIASNSTYNNWSNTASWVGGKVPAVTDNVVIVSGATIIVDGNYSCAGITINAPSAANGIEIIGTNTLTVNGSIIMNAPTVGSIISKISVGTGTLNAIGISIPGSDLAGRICEVTVGGTPAGTLNVTGNITFSGTATQAQLVFTGTGTLNIGGNLSGGGTFTRSVGTVNCNGSSPQTVAGYSYNILKSNNPAGVTLLGASTIGLLTIGDLTVNSIFNDGGFVISPDGTAILNVTSGTYNLGSDAVGTTFPIWREVNLNAGTTIGCISAQSQIVKSMTYYNLTLSGSGTKTTTGVTVDGILSMEGTAIAPVAPSYGAAASLQYNTASGETAGAEWVTPFAGTGGIIIKNTGIVTLNGTKVINHQLTLKSGCLRLGAYNITVASVIGGSASGYVVTDGIGGLIQNVGLGDVSFPVGFTDTYTPVVLNNAGTTDNFTVKVKNTFDHIPFTDHVVNKQWTIAEDIPGGSDAAVKLQWNSSEEIGSYSGFIRTNTVYIGRFDGSVWVESVAVTNLGSGVFTASAKGFSAFSTFDVSNDPPLPVELSSFTSAINGKDVTLHWETKTEKNSDLFVIEKSKASADASSLSWEYVASVKAAVLSNSSKQYSFTDKNLQTGKYQYRLKMMDNNGSLSYSKIIDAVIDLPVNYALNQNYPNPFNPSTKINYTLSLDSKVILEVYNINGEKIAQLVNQEQSAGNYSVDFNSSDLNKNISSGVYFYRLIAVSNSTGKNYSSIKKMLLLK